MVMALVLTPGFLLILEYHLTLDSLLLVEIDPQDMATSLDLLSRKSNVLVHMLEILKPDLILTQGLEHKHKTVEVQLELDRGMDKFNLEFTGPPILMCLKDLPLLQGYRLLVIDLALTSVEIKQPATPVSVCQYLLLKYLLELIILLETPATIALPMLFLKDCTVAKAPFQREEAMLPVVIQELKRKVMWSGELTNLQVRLKQIPLIYK